METTTETNAANTNTTAPSKHIERVNPEKVARFSREMEIDAPKPDTRTLLEKVKALEEAFVASVIAGKAKGETVDGVNCDVCGFDSSDAVTECPFCDENPPGGADAAEHSPDGTSTAPTPEPKTNGAANGAAKKTATPKIAKVKASDVKAAKLAKQAADAALAATKAEPEKHDADAIDAVERLPETTVVVESITTEGQVIVDEVHGEPDPRFTEADLDAAIERVEDCQRGLLVKNWELGCAISDIYSKKLFLQRRDASGKPVYKTFTKFCAAELNFSREYAHTLMDIANAFDQATVAQIGQKKLRVLLTVDDKFRDELKQKAIAGATHTQLASEAKLLMEGQPARETGRRGLRGKGSGTKADPRELQKKSAEAKQRKNAKSEKAAAKGKAARPAGDVVSIVVPRRMKVKAFRAKPDKFNKPVRAMRLADEPKGTFDLPDGSKLHVRASTDATGGILFIVDIERAAS